MQEGTNTQEPRTEVSIPSAVESIHETVNSIVRINWHGWQDCYLMSNGSLEAIVVPAIGRVMQLRLAGDSTGTLWENRALDGRLHQAGHHQWRNFGGDKCWPAPQSAWPVNLGCAWPPPIAFDSLPAEVNVKRHEVILRSPVDAAMGIQVVRHVALDPVRSVMRIRTEFRKLLGSPVTVSIWTITQMQEPERICALLPANSKFDRGYTPLLNAEPAGLKIHDRLLSLIRHPNAYVKIGVDAASLAWVGSNCVVRIEAEVGPGEYPDGGCITQIYTNPDPLHYVELETLGPLTKMSVGDRIERTTVYAVTPRTTPDPEAEALKVF
ncbi:MAG: hypothetical protein ABR976_05525 [Terracidiphilus sp.]